MGLNLSFFKPPLPTLDVANNRMPAFVDMNMFHRDLLLLSLIHI